MVKWTDHAKRHLQEIHHYIAQDSAIYATRVVDNIIRKTIGIDKNPRIGIKSPELNDDQIREVHLYSSNFVSNITQHDCRAGRNSQTSGITSG